MPDSRIKNFKLPQNPVMIPALKKEFCFSKEKKTNHTNKNTL